MSQTLAEQNLSTADIANSPRPTQISNADGANTTTGPNSNVNTGSMNAGNDGRDPNFPDLRPDTAQQTVSGGNSAQDTQDNGRAQLFPQNELQDLRGRWDAAQSAFVDEPRQAVQQADNLVASVVKRIAEQFADERAKLEKQWDSGDNVSTEDLRQALRRYRSFFDRLLSV
jgi:hypothetical protein